MSDTEQALVTVAAPRTPMPAGQAGYTFEQIWRMAQAVATSGMSGATTPEQAMVLLMLADSEGIHPMKALRTFHVIKGKPTMRADAMAARYIEIGGRISWKESTPQRAVATFTNKSGDSITITWDIQDAAKAGLASKENWKMYPAAMLRARVISDGVRASDARAVYGYYTEDEVSANGQATPPAPVITHSWPVEAAKPMTNTERIRQAFVGRDADVDSALPFIESKAGMKLDNLPTARLTALLKHVAAGKFDRDKPKETVNTETGEVQSAPAGAVKTQTARPAADSQIDSWETFREDVREIAREKGLTPSAADLTISKCIARQIPPVEQQLALQLMRAERWSWSNAEESD